MISSDRSEFWEARILQWEDVRYRLANPATKLLAAWSDIGAPIRHRQELAAQLLAPCIKGKVVMDVGCGSGLLCHRLLNTGLKGYIGVDFARSAIERARALARDGGYDSVSTFRLDDVFSVDVREADVVVALGLVDWLVEKDLEVFMSKLWGREFLFSFSERRWSLKWAAHRVFARLAYQDKAILPNYHKPDLIREMVRRHSGFDPQMMRDRRLGLSIFVCHLSGDTHS